MTRYATPSQRRFVLAAKMRPADPSMNWSLLCMLPEGTDPQRMADAVRASMSEYDSAREAFDIDARGDIVATLVPLQHTCDVVHYVDQDELHAATKKRADTPFDLSVVPLYHSEIAVVGTRAYFVFVGAHIVADGRGFYNMTQDFAGHYAGPDYRSPSTSSPVDTAEDTSDRLDDAVAYFAETFAGVESLQIDEWDRRDSKGRIVGDITRSPMPFDEYDGAKQLAGELGVRRYSVLLAVYGLTLACMTGETDLAVSNPMANRRADANAAATRGVRVNSLPVRIDISAHSTFASLCTSIDHQVGKLVEFEQFAFSDFARQFFSTESVDTTQPSAGFTLHPQPLAPVVDGRSGEPVNVDRDYIQYPISLAVEIDSGEVVLIVELARQIPDTDVAALFRTVLRQAVTSLGAVPLDSIDWATGSTAARIDATKHWQAGTLVEAFAASVRDSPDATAVVDEVGRVSYRELADASDRIARAIAAGIDGPMVGVSLEPSIELIATILGILQAGKIYVPIDSTAPIGRLQQIVATCGELNVLGVNDTWDGVDGLRMIDPRTLPPGGEIDGTAVTADAIAYVIFTSGTTGEPKGVQISHSSALRFFDSVRNDLALGAQRWPLMHSISFDISVVEIFNAPLNGAALFIPTAEIKKDPQRLRDYLVDNEIDVISQTPSAFTMLQPLLLDGACPRLKSVVLCGERLELQSLSAFVDARPDVALINCYGITETSMYHTHYRLPSDAAAIPDESVIGIPLSDTTMWVVDREHRTVPRGVPGELVIAGPALMDGYIHREALTAEKVVMIDGVRSYLSGDRGYLATDGQFVVLGRFDSQVKVRGHRCELGEIESALRKTGEVDKVCAMVFGAGLATELVCFVVLKPTGSLDRLRSSLHDWLPRYLEPDHCIALQRIPVNTNGKADTDALAELYRNRADDTPAERQVAAEHTSISEAVDQIWRDVLGNDDFDGSTRFFEAGGSSVLLLRVREEIRSRLGITDFDVVDLFEYCTPDSLSEFLDEIS
ncbi:amino acid adenylation domain-containing protein [Antrihabitans cavernicola]|uniref:Amino acid adenylation domain-containing protein n=1 Tax=Antrihabitans cavernicola TaxID=2495913 RepID=A0A5A7SI42_9NOCA|nr:amino acid adenylation domain-containing protein [Spelaeibacter cavernicola]KAA0024852.1 amino acid adenylation domain-containing protein [Spelaeibacter cavernicola]